MKSAISYTPRAAHLRLSFHGRADSAQNCLPLVFLGEHAQSALLTLLGKNLEEAFDSREVQYVLDAETFNQVAGWALPGVELDLWYIWLEHGGVKAEGLQFSADTGMKIGGRGRPRFLDLRE